MTNGPADVRRIEFWPDYGGVVLHEGGHPVQLADMGLPPDIVARVTGWLADYSDEELTNATWIAEGQSLYATLSRLLARDGIELFDWEGIWVAQTA